MLKHILRKSYTHFRDFTLRTNTYSRNSHVFKELVFQCEILLHGICCKKRLSVCVYMGFYWHCVWESRCFLWTCTFLFFTLGIIFAPYREAKCVCGIPGEPVYQLCSREELQEHIAVSRPVPVTWKPNKYTVTVRIMKEMNNCELLCFVCISELKKKCLVGIEYFEYSVRW